MGTTESNSEFAVNADYFRELERERTQALVAQNMGAVERLHSPEYHLVTPAGKSFDREGYLSAVASGALRYVRWEPQDIEVRLSSGMAIVRYKATLQFPSGNILVCWHTDSYEPQEGRWQAVWSQATAIPQAASVAGGKSAG
jgi:Domain of unknown function (DUF4440)